MAIKPTPPSPARDKVRATVPKLIDLTEKVVYGDVWERPELSKRDRSLITCAALVVLNRTGRLPEMIVKPDPLPPMPPKVDKGEQLLTQARLALRSGDTDTARKLAETVLASVPVANSIARSLPSARASSASASRTTAPSP